MPVAFRRPDQEGRIVVYQPELDIDQEAAVSTAWRVGAGFWSFPVSGCYAVQADGDTFTELTVVPIP